MDTLASKGKELRKEISELQERLEKSECSLSQCKQVMDKQSENENKLLIENVNLIETIEQLQTEASRQILVIIRSKLKYNESLTERERAYLVSFLETQE